MNLTPPFRLYAAARRLQLQRQDPERAQREALRRLLRRARGTRFGGDHGFGSIRDVRDYQSRVPLRDYEDFRDQYWRSFPDLENDTWPGRIAAFALTSGTRRANNKFIPCSRELMRAHMRAIVDVFVHHVSNRRGSQIFAGRNLVLYGSRQLERLAPGVIASDLTGLGPAFTPRWVRLAGLALQDVELIEDWETQIGKLAHRTLRSDVRGIAGCPAWLLFFFARLAEAAGRGEPRLAELMPDLELLVHGGVGMEPYRLLFERLLEGSHAELRETYASSEGFIGICDRGPGEGLRLVLDDLFLEFVPVEDIGSRRPARHWIADVEMGREYAVVVTNCGGLWAYVLGDTVRFVSREPPRVVVTGRLGSWLNVFGEHVIETELNAAVGAAAHAIGHGVVDFSVGSIMPQRQGEAGHHRYFVEFSPALPGDAALAAFVARLDAEMQRLNDNYRLYRSRDIVIGPPRVTALAPGTFFHWMKSRGRVGGQSKVPRVLDGTAQFADLERSAGRKEASS